MVGSGEQTKERASTRETEEGELTPRRVAVHDPVVGTFEGMELRYQPDAECPPLLRYQLHDNDRVVLTIDRHPGRWVSWTPDGAEQEPSETLYAAARDYLAGLGRGRRCPACGCDVISQSACPTHPLPGGKFVSCRTACGGATDWSCVNDECGWLWRHGLNRENPHTGVNLVRAPVWAG